MEVSWFLNAKIQGYLDWGLCSVWPCMATFMLLPFSRMCFWCISTKNMFSLQSEFVLFHFLLTNVSKNAVILSPFFFSCFLPVLCPCVCFLPFSTFQKSFYSEICGHRIFVLILTPYTQVQIISLFFFLCFLVKREHTCLKHLGMIYITTKLFKESNYGLLPASSSSLWMTVKEKIAL